MATTPSLKGTGFCYAGSVIKYFMIKTLLRSIDRIHAPGIAYAHCDIPCGVYNIHAAATASETVRVMTEKIIALDEQNHHDAGFHNTMSRLVAVKEEHAGIVKDELQMLWSDYFKEEHLEKLPDLHDVIWGATKLCSTVRREVNLDAAKELEGVVAKVGEMMNTVA